MITLPHVIALSHVGSRVTCDPAPTDTDDDWLALISMPHQDKVYKELIGQNFVPDTSEHYAQILDQWALKFISWKKNELNIILTGSAAFYDRFMLATRVATKLNLLKKEDRIILFKEILYT